MSDQPIRIFCSECGYSHVIHPDDDGRPADYIVEHGRETGHLVLTERLHEDPARLSP